MKNAARIFRMAWTVRHKDVGKTVRLPNGDRAEVIGWRCGDAVRTAFVKVRALSGSILELPAPAVGLKA